MNVLGSPVMMASGSLCHHPHAPLLTSSCWEAEGLVLIHLTSLTAAHPGAGTAQLEKQPSTQKSSQDDWQWQSLWAGHLPSGSLHQCAYKVHSLGKGGPLSFFLLLGYRCKDWHPSSHVYEEESVSLGAKCEGASSESFSREPQDYFPTFVILLCPTSNAYAFKP